MNRFRLDTGVGIDRSRSVNFTFNGKRYSGFEGDTLASALVANGVKLVGRSFKYHRPRGLLAAGPEEPNAIVQVGRDAHTIPNLKATSVELFEGLEARSVNAWPSVHFDVMSVNSLMGRFIPAGFYYKTFMWPDWRLFEPTIRKAAGLGRAPNHNDPDVYDKSYAECDVLVVGGGAPGLFAALTAGRAGARVLLVEQDRLFGGYCLSHPADIDGRPALDWINAVRSEIETLSNVTVMNRTMAFGYYDHNLVALLERRTDHLPEEARVGARQRLWKVRARRVILATGTIERPLVFPNNDRPGVMLASAAETYVNRYGAKPGDRVVIGTNNDTAYRVARTLTSAGVDIVGVADTRPMAQHATWPSSAITNVIGGRAVRGVELHRIDGNGCPSLGSGRTVACDLVLMAGGWSPAVHLFSQSGGTLRFDTEQQAFVPGAAVQETAIIGAANGARSMKSALEQAVEAAHAAVRALNLETVDCSCPSAEGDQLEATHSVWQVDVSALGRHGAKSWLDFQNDVTGSDVKLALRENFRSVEHVKRYTTLGMASDQGKTSNVNGIGVMSEVLDRAPADVGTTKFRPPYDPVSVGAFAGRRTGDNLLPARFLAAHKSHEALGAEFEDFGPWRRPACYPKVGESYDEAIEREVLGVRNGLGLFEASPLGKIEVKGPDAAAFLNFMYVNNMKTLKPGRCRYGLMLSETGIVYDDGILACLSKEHYLVGTTSGHADAIAGLLQEWLQCEFVHHQVVTENVTTSWAVVNINGEKARDVLESAESDIDFSKDAFPHMAYREGFFEGAPCRIQRVSFTGELSYEISVPWGYGKGLWDLLMERGAPFGITPFGIEALQVMRIEKGFLHVGSETDGMTFPQDVGFDGVIAKKADDFVGRRSAHCPVGRGENRRQFVGLKTLSGEAPLQVGAHILSDTGALSRDGKAKTEGWVTSSAYSPTLKKPVALAMIEGGRRRIGEEVIAWDLGNERRVKIIAPGLFDRDGERLRG